MSRVKQVSKRKRLTKAAGVSTLGAAGLGLSLAGSASASALPTADVPQSLNTAPNQRFVLGEEEMADVSLATFHIFDKENGTGGFTQVARGCGCGGCHGCGGGGGCRGCGVGGGCRGCGGCGCRGCGAAVAAAAVVSEAAAYRGASAVFADPRRALLGIDKRRFFGRAREATRPILVRTIGIVALARPNSLTTADLLPTPAGPVMK